MRSLAHGSLLRPAVLLFALLPTACGSGVDARRATICRRALPAIAPHDAAIHVLRIGFGPGGDSVRVDYGLSGRPEVASRARWLVCGFGPGANLISILTERGPLGEASLYLLKRYYLDTPDAERADPGR